MLPACGQAASRIPATSQRYVAGTRSASGSRPFRLPSKGMDGREDLLPRLAVCKTGPQEMTGRADVTRVAEQSPAGRATVQAHLIFIAMQRFCRIWN